MASYYIPIQGPRVNAMLDFSPINNAIDGYQNQQNKNRAFGMQEQQIGMDRERLGLAKNADARAEAGQARQWKREDVQLLGQQSAAADRLPPGSPERMAAWQRIMAQHGGQGLSPEEMDPITGPKLLMAQAGQFRDPLDAQRKQAELAQLRAQTQALGRNDVMSEFIMRQLGGGGAPTPQAPGQPSIQPQSFAPPQGGNAMMQNASDPGGAMPQPMTQQPEANPYLIQTQAGAGPEQAPAAQQERMVQTPYGVRSESEARRLGGAMLLVPRFAQAGKEILDSLGPVNPDALGKEGRNEIEKKMIAASDNLTNLASVRLQFKPEFQQIENRIGMAWTAFADKFKAGKAFVKPEDRAALEEYSAFRSDAFDGFNAYIKSITGAAMTESEAQRIMKAFPAPGEGVFDGDSPTQFKAKLDQAYEKSKAAVARYNYARQNGKDWQYIGLNQMADIVRKRGNALQSEVKRANPNIDQMSLQGEVRSRLKQEFGI